MSLGVINVKNSDTAGISKKNINWGTKGEKVSKIGGLRLFLRNRSLKVSNFLLDRRRL